MANVKVALRVRPMSKRESAEGGRVIVEVDGKVAKIRNIKSATDLHEMEQNVFSYTSGLGKRPRL